MNLDRFHTGVLRRFEIEGFRNLGHGAGINIKQLNLFVGPNGSGKSTVLSAFQLFHVAVLEAKIQRIDVGLVDQFGLIVKQEHPFTVRFIYEELIFEYEYKVDHGFNWICQRMAILTVDLESGKRLKFIDFMKEYDGGFEMNSAVFPIFFPRPESSLLGAVDDISGKFRPYTAEEKEQLASVWKLADEFLLTLNRLSSMDIEYGKLKMATAVALEMDGYKGNKWNLYLLTNEGYPEMMFRPYPAFKSLITWLSGFNYASYHTLMASDYKVACLPRVIASTQGCSDAVVKAYESFGIDGNEPFGHEVVTMESENGDERGKLLSNVKKVLAFRIISEGYENNIELARILEMLLVEKQGDNVLLEYFIRAIRTKSNYLHWIMLALKNGCSDHSHGILPPHSLSYAGWNGVKLLQGAFHHSITLASQLSVKGALTENSELRKWVLRRLGEGGNVVLNIPEVHLNCKISFDKNGGLDVFTRKKGVQIEIEGLSRGEQKLILIHLYRNFNAFIEEPEANLHPSYQSILGRIISQGYVSKAAFTENDFDYDQDFGFVDLGEPPEDGDVKSFVWKYEAHRDYQFIETHSDILIKAIQLEMARNLPTPALWLEHPDLTPSFKEVQKQFSELDPNIEVTYFDTVDGKSVPKSMGLRRDGVFREEFGPGFYDESLQLVRDIFDLKSQN